MGLFVTTDLKTIIMQFDRLSPRGIGVYTGVRIKGCL